MNRIMDFLTANGTRLMIAGFTIIAVVAGAFGVMVLKHMATARTQDWMFVVVVAGFAVYLAGRIGLSMQRRRERRTNEFTDKNRSGT